MGYSGAYCAHEPCGHISEALSVDSSRKFQYLVELYISISCSHMCLQLSTLQLGQIQPVMHKLSRLHLSWIHVDVPILS